MSANPKKITLCERKILVSELVTACGGTMSVAMRCGIAQTAVIQWCMRGKIPQRHAKKIYSLVPKTVRTLDFKEFELLPIF